MRDRNSLATFLFLAAVTVLLGTIPDLSFAGTGGGELSVVWAEITSGLQGFWGKVIAAAFVGFAIMALKGGQAIWGIVLFIVGMLVGAIPGIIDARFTLTF